MLLNCSSEQITTNHYVYFCKNVGLWRHAAASRTYSVPCPPLTTDQPIQSHQYNCVTTSLGYLGYCNHSGALRPV